MQMISKCPIALAVLLSLLATANLSAADLQYSVSWLGNSFSGADNKWVQNLFIDMVTAPDGSCYTWSHWDEGGKKFGIYKDGDVVGNKDVKANSLQVDMRHIGRIFVCRNYLAGNRDAIRFISGAGSEAACVAAAGDYVFTGGWKERGRIHTSTDCPTAPKSACSTPAQRWRA